MPYPTGEGDIGSILSTAERLSKEKEQPEALETAFSEAELEELRRLSELLDEIIQMDDGGDIKQNLASKGMLFPQGNALRDREYAVDLVQSNARIMQEFLKWAEQNIVFKNVGEDLKEKLYQLRDEMSEWGKE